MSSEKNENETMMEATPRWNFLGDLENKLLACVKKEMLKIDDKFNVETLSLLSYNRNAPTPPNIHVDNKTFTVYVYNYSTQTKISLGSAFCNVSSSKNGLHVDDVCGIFLVTWDLKYFQRVKRNDWSTNDDVLKYFPNFAYFPLIWNELMNHTDNIYSFYDYTRHEENCLVHSIFPVFDPRRCDFVCVSCNASVDIIFE